VHPARDAADGFFGGEGSGVPVGDGAHTLKIVGGTTERHPEVWWM